MTDKGLLDRLREIAPDLAAQILDNARAENLSPADVEAKLKSALEWQMHRERVENDLKAHGIELNEDGLDEVASELLMLPILLERMEMEGLKRRGTITTDELLKRLEAEREIDLKLAETTPFEELARDAVREYRRGETVSLRRLAEAEGVEQKNDDWDPRESKALRESLDELHAIRAKLYQEEKGLSPDERVAKTRRESQQIIDKYGLPVLEPEEDDDPTRDAEKLETYLKALEHMKTDDEGD